MKRSEIWLINLDPTIGAEIKKTRPSVIISSNDLGTLPLRIIAPITEWKPHYAQVPWMVKILPNQNSGLTKFSAIDLFQIRSVSTTRFIRQLGIIDEKTMKFALDAVVEVLEITN
ncbi:MAG: PemK family transcriptional regulator [Chloroflexi bacterium HGW-Chloroflexi-2]|jgi:mRNA interferase MazF|nr:MAG: PemK family transcriptional regulator [Chloroflexi bacterium HGW-Chloroflexi-2]